MKSDEIAKLLLIVSGAFPNNQTNETTFPTWETILEKVPFKYGERALMAYIAGGNAFAPTAGQILQGAREMRDGIAPPAELALEMAIKGAKELHPRIKEVLEYVDITPLIPKTTRYNPYASHVPARDEMFEANRARRSFITAYTEGIDFNLKKHSRQLTGPERALLDGLKVKEIQ